MSAFYCAERRNCGPKTPTSLHEKKTGWRQWALIFSVDVHMELTPLTLVRRRPPEPDPLHVDVINGWPHTGCCLWGWLMPLLPWTASSLQYEIVRCLCFMSFARYIGEYWPCTRSTVCSLSASGDCLSRWCYINLQLRWLGCKCPISTAAL